MPILEETVELKLNPFEFGMLYGILAEVKNELPAAMKLKLEIAFVKQYIDHPTMGEQAKEELKEYELGLSKLQGKSNIQNS